MSTAEHLNVRPTKRRRVDRTHHASLTNLPHDLLVTIVSHRPRSTHYVLSQVCVALCAAVRELHRSWLHTIDLAPGAALADAPPNRPVRHNPLESHYLTLAGTELHVLRIPSTFPPSTVTTAIQCIVRHCNNLETLAFFDDGIIDRKLARRIVANLPRLRTLEVGMIGDALLANLSDCVHLKDLNLPLLRTPSLPLLSIFLAQRAGQPEQTLELFLQLFQTTTIATAPSLNMFLCFLRNNGGNLPFLSRLHVHYSFLSSDFETFAEHLKAVYGHGGHIFGPQSTIILHKTYANGAMTSYSRREYHVLLWYLSSIVRIFGRSTASDHGEECKPGTTPQVCENGKETIRHLTRLIISVTCIKYLNSVSTEQQTRAFDFLETSCPALKEVRIESSTSDVRSLFILLLDIFTRCPSITRLRICWTIIARFLHLEETRFFFENLAHIEVLYLRSYFGGPTRTSCHHFVRILPKFLDILGNYCHKLRVAYMQKMSGSLSLKNQALPGHLFSALKALRRFEERNSNVDVRTIKWTVEQWIADIENDGLTRQCPYLE